MFFHSQHAFLNNNVCNKAQVYVLEKGRQKEVWCDVIITHPV